MPELHGKDLQSVIDYGYSKKLSKKSLKNIRGVIIAWLKYCRKCRYTTLIPDELTIPKAAPVSEKAILQPEALRVLFGVSTTTYGREEPFINAYRFQCATGLRPGEVLGLKWSDIFRDTVHINRSINAFGETTSCKNDNARRSFQLTELAKSILITTANIFFHMMVKFPHSMFTATIGKRISKQTSLMKMLRRMACGILLYQ